MCSKSPYPFILLLQEKLIKFHTPQLVLGISYEPFLFLPCYQMRDPQTLMVKRIKNRYISQRKYEHWSKKADLNKNGMCFRALWIWRRKRKGHLKLVQKNFISQSKRPELIVRFSLTHTLIISVSDRGCVSVCPHNYDCVFFFFF